MIQLLATLAAYSLLFAVTVYSVVRVLVDGALGAEPALLVAAMFLSVIVAEWHWKHLLARTAAVLLRFAVLWVAFGWLFWCLLLGRPYRQAMGSENPVTALPRIGGDSIPLTPFNSGVSTMLREVGTGVNEAWLPILVLFWVAALPAWRALRELDAEGRRGGAVTLRNRSPGE